MTSGALLPDGVFPTQLKQTVQAVTHLIKSGTRPENIQFFGDSAGTIAIIGLFSHLLHPMDGIEPLSLSAPFGGAYLMSPWVTLSNKNGTWGAGDSTDWLSASVLASWGAEVTPHVPLKKLAYVEPLSASDLWFEGVDKKVKRMLITAGGAECLREDILKFGRKISKHHRNTRIEILAHGVHDHPLWEFMSGKVDTGPFLPIIVDWYFKGFEQGEVFLLLSDLQSFLIYFIMFRSHSSTKQTMSPRIFTMISVLQLISDSVLLVDIAITFLSPL